MMAAVQPFISGAISKTVNMPESATRRRGRGDLLPVLEDGHQGARDLPRQLQGRPAAVRRQGDKAGADSDESAAVETVVVETRPTPQASAKSRASRTVSFSVGGAEGYMTAGAYEDGTLGEVFIKMSASRVRPWPA